MKIWEYRINGWTGRTAEEWVTGVRWMVRRYYAETAPEAPQTQHAQMTVSEQPHLAGGLDKTVVKVEVPSQGDTLLVEVVRCASG